MKNLLISILLFAFASTTFAQDKNAIAEQQLPAPVKSNFHHDFPTATDLKWEKEGSNFEANFKVDHLTS